MAKAVKIAARPPADSVSPAPLAVAAAIKALHAGEATAYQQQIALQWILREACGKAYFPYYGSDRDTIFALGRVFVADVIIGMFNADLSSLRVNHETPPPEA